MLTEKQLEAAARELCRLRGVDPDKRIAHGADPDPSGYVLDVLLYSCAWKRASREIALTEQLNAAIACGAKVRELVSLGDFNAKRSAAYNKMGAHEPMPNGIACPKCGAELLDMAPSMTLTSSPPQKNVGCKACGYEGYRVA